MKKRYAIVAIIVCIVITFTACEGNSIPSISSESNASAETYEDSSSLRVTYAEDDMPVNTPDNQKYLDKYIIPYAVTALFARDFGPKDYSDLKDSLMNMFDALQQSLPDGIEKMESYHGIFPQDVVEDLLVAHFNLTPEQIREYCSDYYNADQQAYNYTYGLGGGPAEFVITSSFWDGDTLTLSYDWFGGDDKNPTDTFRYALIYQGQVRIEVVGDNFKYISNTHQRAPGND